MLSLIDSIDNFISWPRQCEYTDMSEQFDAMGRYVNLKHFKGLPLFFYLMMSEYIY